MQGQLFLFTKYEKILTIDRKKDTMEGNYGGKEMARKFIEPDIPGLVRMTRALSGLSQDEFGQIFSVTGKTISNWEHGTTDPSRAKLWQLVQDYHGLVAKSGLDIFGIH